MTGFLPYLGQRVAGLLLGGLLALGPAGAEPVIFAAASTRTALEDALEAGAFPATVSYGASGTIARQIVQGAPADVFLSANPKWMRFLVDEGLVAAGTIEVLASNRLVLIGPDDKPPLALDKRAVEARLGGEFFAVADPQVAPVGQYGREAMRHLGLWASIAPVLLPTRNTIATVATVASGEAALGLVYRSDALGVDGVAIAAEIPGDSHAPIHYLIAPVIGGDTDAADALINHLTGPAGQLSFAARGFATISKEGS